MPSVATGGPIELVERGQQPIEGPKSFSSPVERVAAPFGAQRLEPSSTVNPPPTANPPPMEKCSGTVFLPTPAELQDAVPLSPFARNLISSARAAVKSILQGDDTNGKLLVVVGPCSIHDPVAALEYAASVKKWQSEFQNELVLVMRTYCEKPRTVDGWKGLIRDPKIDGSDDILLGLTTARQLLAQISDMGVPCGAEVLDPMVAPYLQDAFAWAAIGARTVESQVHRDLACVLSDLPLGFKNGTTGDVTVAIESLAAVCSPRSVLTVDPATGRICQQHLPGRRFTHVVLRGGKHGPNYGATHVHGVLKQLTHRFNHLPESASCRPSSRVVIDCSHGNSGKDYSRQSGVAGEIAQMLGDHSDEAAAIISQGIAGIMLESFLFDGRQDRPERYGVSITDGCMDLSTTHTTLALVAASVRKRRELSAKETQ